MEFDINYWAVLASAVASMALGFLWYGPLFGKTWISLMGFTEEKIAEAKAKGMTRAYLMSFVGALVTAYVLRHFVQVWKVGDAIGAFQLAFWVWLGFVATTMLATVLWEGKPIKLYILNIGYHLVSLYLMTIILAFWV
jgi:hypothetical protein